MLATEDQVIKNNKGSTSRRLLWKLPIPKIPKKVEIGKMPKKIELGIRNKRLKSVKDFFRRKFCKKYKNPKLEHKNIPSEDLWEKENFPGGGSLEEKNFPGGVLLD